MTRQSGHLNGQNTKIFEGQMKTGARGQRASVFPTIKEQHFDWCCSFAVFMKIGPYETSMAFTAFFSSFSTFGRTTVRMPSSTLAEILSFSTSSGNV